MFLVLGMPLPIFGKSHKSPADVVKNLKEALVAVEKVILFDFVFRSTYVSVFRLDVLGLTFSLHVFCFFFWL